MSTRILKNYIGGEWVPSSSADLADVTNPATGETIARVPLSSADDVGAAVAAASRAFGEWRETPILTRVRYLFALRELMERDFESLARGIVREHGKILDEARGEARRTIEMVQAATAMPSLLTSYGTEDIALGIDEECLFQPAGVFTCITPFNFPAMVPFMFWPFAVACGDTYVIKPSEICPMTQNRIMELVDEAGFPPGVVNLVNGARAAVDALLTHPDVVGVSFVGSTPVGRYIHTTAAAHGKRVQCQAGAKNCIVVMPDADLGAAVPNILASVYGNAGQRCLAGSVILGVGDAYEPLRDRLVEAARGIMKVGDGMDETVQLGPVVTRRAYDRIRGMIARGVEEGAELLLDGRTVEVPGYPNGCFIGPTIFDRVRPEMSLAREEIFGPVLSLMHAADFDEALDVIRGIPFGNAASIFTSGGHWAREFKYRVRCGNIGVNIGVPAPMSTFPLAGMKDSFFGDLHGQGGPDALYFFTDRKVVITRWTPPR